LDYRPLEIRQIKTCHECLLLFAESESHNTKFGNPVYGYVT